MLKGAKAWLTGFAAIVLVGVMVGVPRAIDNTGWLSHQRDTDMYFGSAEWSVGTYRDCAALPVRDGSILFLGCVMGAETYLTPQTVPVTYWGKINRPDRYQAAISDLTAWKWKCLRKKDAVTCWAVN